MPDKPNSYAEWHKEQRIKPMIETRPYLLPFLLKLDVIESKAKTLTVGQSYNLIFKLIRKALGKPAGASVGNYYTLWTKGVPLDHLKSVTRKQALEMCSVFASTTPRRDGDAALSLQGA